MPIFRCFVKKKLKVYHLFFTSRINPENKSMKSIITFIVFSFLLYLPACIARPIAGTIENYAIADSVPNHRQNVRIAFYNVENLYDTYDDSTTLDNEFTPDGIKHWSYSKFHTKLHHLAKSLIALEEWDTLAFIGLCEVENRYVLNKLLYESPLKGAGYRIIHNDSPDARGVDVCALYHPSKMQISGYRYYTVRYPFDTAAKTRDILYVRAVVGNGDTLHLFVNHWPSRRGGQEESNPRRNFVASLLRHLTDSLLIAHCTSLIIMGDLNDEPWDTSVCQVLGAKTDAREITERSLYNLMGIQKRRWNEGTLKYRGTWSIFDQFIVSGHLLGKHDEMVISDEGARVFDEPFLMQEDPVYLGRKLNRTYVGPRHTGGFSDHLPIYLDLYPRP